MMHTLDGMFENPMEDLNKILKDLNIKKNKRSNDKISIIY
jgi:hypothetical protein